MKKIPIHNGINFVNDVTYTTSSFYIQTMTWCHPPPPPPPPLAIPGSEFHGGGGVLTLNNFKGGLKRRGGGGLIFLGGANRFCFINFFFYPQIEDKNKRMDVLISTKISLGFSFLKANHYLIDQFHFNIFFVISWYL